jgi:uncharacterized protein
MVELLQANGADVNKSANMGMTALEGTALFGNVQCARALVAAGADVNHFNSKNMTCLHAANKAHRAAIVKLLLGHGATAVMNSVLPLNCFTEAHCCNGGVTALMICTETDTLKLLLAAGADVNITNRVGDTCLHVAAKHNWKPPMICLLIKAGVDLHAVST